MELSLEYEVECGLKFSRQASVHLISMVRTFFHQIKWQVSDVYMLIYSLCGYSHKERQCRHDVNVSPGRRLSKKRKKTWERRVGFDFTGCLAHIDLTECAETRSILRIRGIRENSRGCESEQLQRLPYMPLHEHVYKVALWQLEAGARCVEVHCAATKARTNFAHSALI